MERRRGRLRDRAELSDRSRLEGQQLRDRPCQRLLGEPPLPKQRLGGHFDRSLDLEKQLRLALRRIAGREDPHSGLVASSMIRFEIPQDDRTHVPARGRHYAWDKAQTRIVDEIVHGRGRDNLNAQRVFAEMLRKALAKALWKVAIEERTCYWTIDERRLQHTGVGPVLGVAEQHGQQRPRQAAASRWARQQLSRVGIASSARLSTPAPTMSSMKATKSS